MNNFGKVSETRKLTYFAILTALTLVLQLVGNQVKIGIVTLNFSLIPIVLCAILLGVWYGTALGAITGLIILLNNGILGADGFTNVLFGVQPVVIIFVCILKTALAGALSALIFKWMYKVNKYVGTFLAAGIVPVINTLIFVLGMLLIVPSLVSVGFIAEGANAFTTIIVGFVGLNFVFEFAVNLIVAPAIFRVVTVIDKSFIGGSKDSETEESIKTDDKAED